MRGAGNSKVCKCVYGVSNKSRWSLGAHVSGFILGLIFRIPRMAVASVHVNSKATKRPVNVLARRRRNKLTTQGMALPANAAPLPDAAVTDNQAEQVVRVDAADGESNVAPPIVIEPRGVTPADTAVFVIGVFPFVWATQEFFRRVSLGLPFGTGNDSVVFPRTDGDGDGDGDGDEKIPGSRFTGGRQQLSKPALYAAYVLFGLAAGSVGLALYSAYDLLVLQAA